MSFESTVLASVARALVVAGLVAPVAGSVAARLGGTSSARERVTGTAMLLAVLVAPGFVVAYAWTPWTLALPPWAGSALAALLLALALLPIGVGLAWLLPPPPVTRSASHALALARRLGARVPPRLVAGCLLRGPLQPMIVRGGVVFLLAFHDFQLAAVLGQPAWTVWVFDAQVGGLTIGATSRHALLPAAIAAIVLVVVLALALASGTPARDRPAARVPSAAAHVWTVLAFVVVVVVPVVMIGSEAVAAVPAGVKFAVGHELGSSLAFAAFGGGIALAVAFLVLGRARGGAPPSAVAVAAPGLLGGLVVALAVQSLFQLPVARELYDTPIPLALALGIVLVPVALGCTAFARRSSRSAAAHAAVLAEARRVLWWMRGRPRTIALALLFVLAAFELTAAAILAPTGLTPATVRLYNLMHYGHSAGLSAMVAGTVVAVAAVVAVGYGTARWWECRSVRG